MGKYRIDTPDGKSFEIDGPDDATEEQLNEAIRSSLGGRFSNSRIENRKNPITEADKALGSKPGYKDLVMQGASLGFADEAAGAVNAVLNPLTTGAYAEGRDAVRGRVEQARKETGWAGTAAEFGGGLLTAIPQAGAQALLSTGQAARRGLATGAGIGALAGFGNGEGLPGSLITAGAGAVLGGGLGGAIPLLANVAANRIGGLSRFLGSDTDGLSRQIVGQAMQADANSPALAGAAVSEANGRGVPMMFADTGENARGLLASVARRPGGARTLAREAVGQRQVEQGDRVVGAIGRDLGPVANVRQQSDTLMTQARTDAAPLYAEAYAVPGRTSAELESILETPAGKQALNRARTIAANERRDPNAMGFDLDEQGETILTSVPSTQTLDYVKRGLDDILEQARDPVTRQIQYTPSLRAIEDVRKSLIREADNLNPAYGAARAAFAGPASAEEALQLGRQSLTDSAEDIEAAIQRMGPAEREQYALGFRAAMADNLGRAVDGADKVGRLLGTPRKRAALAEVFGGEENFGRFLQTMQDERATNETYRSVMTGSQTAERLAADAETTDTGLAETAMNVATRGSNTTALGLFGDALKALREVDRSARERPGTVRARASQRCLRRLIRRCCVNCPPPSTAPCLDSDGIAGSLTLHLANSVSGTGANAGALAGGFTPD